MKSEKQAEIIEVIQRTPNVKSLRLGVGERADFKAGQFLRIFLGKEPRFSRYLSISNSPTETGFIECTKKITESDFSRSFNSLKPKDKVLIQYPFGNFTLDEAYERVAFLSGGIGITPIRSICKYVVDKNTGTDLVLLYANRTFGDIAFREDFEKMQKDYPKLKVAHVICEAHEGFRCAVGHINSLLIKQEIPDYLTRKFYLCGPPAMVEAMCKLLTEELGLSSEKIIKENFQGY